MVFFSIFHWQSHLYYTSAKIASKAYSGYWHTATVNQLVRRGLATSALVCTWMGDRISMSISDDSPSDETINQGPLALLLRRQYEFPFGINIVQFSIFNNMYLRSLMVTLQDVTYL